MNKLIQKAARKDRTNWIYQTLVGGSWDAVKRLGKSRKNDMPEYEVLTISLRIPLPGQTL